MERMKASLRRGLSLLLVFMLVIGCASLDFGKLGGLQAFADESSPETILYNYFNGHGKANETPLVFPYGTEAGQYTNATDFIKGESVKVLKDAGIDNITESDISVTATFGGIYGGKVGAGTKYEAVTMDTAGNITPVYAEKATTPKVQNLTIGVNGKEASMIKLLSLSVDPIAVTTQQKVDMEAELLTWDYIKGKNTSIDHVVNPLGKLSGNNAVLSNIKPALFTVVTDNKVGVEIKWALSYTGEGADPKCLELTTKGSTVTTTIQRPNVGEADASYRLTATVASKTEPDVKKDVNFDVTVPAFEACNVPFKITPADATLTITDSIFKKPVDDKYITVSPDGLTRTVKLHKSTTDANQSFSYEVAKAGYLTKKASVSVSGDMPEIEINLTPESAEDTKLSNLGITDPAAGTVSIKQPMAAFDKDTYEYTMKVGAVPSVTIKPETAVAGAGVTVSYYQNASKANSNTLSTKSLSSGGTLKCFLKTSEDDETTTEIAIKVTAPAGSSQEAKNYKLTVVRDPRTYPLEGLTIEPQYRDGYRANNLAEPKEEELSPGINTGGVESRYVYLVNSGAESVKLTPKAVTGAKSITVDGKEVASGSTSEAINLKEGNNNIVVRVTAADGKTHDYNILVHKKKDLDIKKIEVNGGLSYSPAAGNNAYSMNFPKDVENLDVKVTASEGSKFSVKVGNDVKGSAESGNTVTLPASGEKKLSTYITVSNTYTLDGEEWTDSIVNVVGFYRMGSEAPDNVVSYLPAPGQFVNTDSYNNPLVTLGGTSSRGMVTLGAFGGSIVYYFADAITDDPRNPYGIDFIIFGNVFANSDGSSSAGASEPAAVCVSEDGKTWYELAGSSYYDGATKHNIKVTYKNNDTAFKASADVPWEAADGSSGAVLKNDYHKQPYYPNPATYDKYNQGLTANGSYTADSVSFIGNLYNWYITPYYGYGDSHLQNSAMGSSASNPYVKNHYVGCNGDGMDLAWAVDESGNLQSMKGKEIHYVKVYNPILFDGGARGEISAEIQGIVRAKANNSEVGKTEPLKALTINGTALSLSGNKFNYTFDAKGASTLKVNTTAANADANIIVNDQYVKSGEDSPLIMGTDKFRIVVQEGNKEPQIYTISLSNIKTPAKNADLRSVSVIPGDIAAKRASDGSFKVTVPAATKAVRLKAVPMNNEAKVSIEGDKSATEDNDWTGSTNLALDPGQTKTVTITVTSKDGTVSQDTKVEVTRAGEASQSEEANQIKVSFTLVGDKIHDTPEKHTKFETWIKTTTVTVKKGATVKEVTDKMLIDNNMAFTTKSHGNYIANINGIGEFDNGPNSGWMYSVNGVEPEEGYGTYVLKDGDSIRWFYTDDYTKEQSSEKWNKKTEAETATAALVPEKKKDTQVVKVEATVDKKGEAKVEVSGDQIKDAVEGIKDKTDANIEIKPTGAENAQKVAVGINSDVLSKVGKETKADLKVATSIGEVRIPNAEVKELAEKAGNSKNLAVNLEKVKDETGKETGAVKLEISLGSSSIDKLSKKVVASIPTTGATSGQVLAVVKEDGTREILKKSMVVSGQLTGLIDGSCTLQPVDNSKEFEDVSSHWGKQSIDFVTSHELFQGIGGKTFGPNEKLNRGMVITVICRLEDGKASSSGNFADVDDSSWFGNAANWAKENGIATGNDKGFSPLSNINREELVTMIGRYAELMGMDLKTDGNLGKFKDGENVSSWAKKSMAWAVSEGIIKGDANGLVNPKGEATRAEFSAVTQRLVALMIQN